MTTINKSVGTSWTKIADTSYLNFMISWESNAVLEFATTSGDFVPTVTGHRLSKTDAVSRGVLGNGYVWAKVAAGSKPATADLVISDAPSTTGQIVQALTHIQDEVEYLGQFNNFSSVDTAGGDFVTFQKGTNGQNILALSGNPLTTGESNIYGKAGVMQPAALEAALTFVHAAQHFAILSLFENPAAGPAPLTDPINITSIYQCSNSYGGAYNATAGTHVTINLETALPEIGGNRSIYLGDWINVTGLTGDYVGLNYQNLCIYYISYDRKTIACQVADESTVGSAARTVTPTLGTAKVSFYQDFTGARNAVGIRYSGNSNTTAALLTCFASADTQVSGSATGDQRTTVGNMGPNYVSGATTGQYELRSNIRYRIQVEPNMVNFMDKGEQSNGVFSNRDTRTSVKPLVGAYLTPRIRLYKPISMVRPTIKILKAEKLTASSTATVYTDGAHGLITGTLVNLTGSRDAVTNYPNVSGVAITVTGANTFTVTWGAAAIATSYGGSVSVANGMKNLPGVITQTIQQASSFTTSSGNNGLMLVGSANWALLAAGDYINIHGMGNATDGTTLGLDGAWEITGIATTTLYLEPIFDINGNRISPALGTLNSTNCGGTVILRPTARLHDFQMESWNDSVTRIEGQGSGRWDRALPVNVLSGVTVAQGTTATISTSTGFGGWPIHPAVTRINDVASAAITSTTTSSSLTNTHGNAFQFNLAVTAVTGTTPAMDVRVEESYDGGTNWVTLYEFPRITATGSYNSPVLRVAGQNIRYVRTLSGTSPSFTMAVNRSILPFSPASQLRRLFDRALAVNTANSTSTVLPVFEAANVQAVINMGAVTTTAPSITIQGSEDNANWYDLGTAIATVANSTKEATYSLRNAAFVRAIVTGAGSGATLGYISLKAFGG